MPRTPTPNGKPFDHGQQLTAAITAIPFQGMPQLLVRNIEPAVVKKLRSRAAAEGVSVEEAHRRVLRSALLGRTPGPDDNFIAYLRGIPASEAIAFPRSDDPPREIDL